jgi:hypothetical protein
MTKLVGFIFLTEKFVHDSLLAVGLLDGGSVSTAGGSSRRFLDGRGGFFEPTLFGAEVAATLFRFLPGKFFKRPGILSLCLAIATE